MVAPPAAAVLVTSAMPAPRAYRDLDGERRQQNGQVMAPGMPTASVTLEEHGNAAIESGQYELRMGSEVADDGSHVVVHRRQPDGSWRLGIDIFNSDRPASPPA
jgi:ketosteroid isomerase-like protein